MSGTLSVLLRRVLECCVRTKSTLPLPDSFTANGYEMSSWEEGSCSRRKAWCDLFAVLPSCVVRMILRLSEAPNLTGLDKGLPGVSLDSQQRACVASGMCTSP